MDICTVKAVSVSRDSAELESSVCSQKSYFAFQIPRGKLGNKKHTFTSRFASPPDCDCFDYTLLQWHNSMTASGTETAFSPCAQVALFPPPCLSLTGHRSSPCWPDQCGSAGCQCQQTPCHPELATPSESSLVSLFQPEFFWICKRKMPFFFFSFQAPLLDITSPISPAEQLTSLRAIQKVSPLWFKTFDLFKYPQGSKMPAIKGLWQNYVMTIIKVPQMDCVPSLWKHTRSCCI